LLLLGLKLAWEQLAGPLPGSEALSGGPVVVDAHLYGTSAGLLGVWLLELRRRPAGYRAAPPPSRRGPRE